jgi:hypothetical protein
MHRLRLRGHRQLAGPEQRIAEGVPWINGGYAAVATPLIPPKSGMPALGSAVLDGGKVIAAEKKEVVDLVVGEKETLCLAG